MSNQRSTSEAKLIRFENDLLALIDQDVNGGNFSAWVKDACREKLDKKVNYSKQNQRVIPHG